MPKEVSQVRVFVSCPDDVASEKELVRKVCESLSVVLINSHNIEVSVIDWDRTVIHHINGEGGQAVINRQIGEFGYDIYIGIL